MNSYAPQEPSVRSVILTPASSITPRPVVWWWRDRIATGTLAVGAGREGTGKSQHACWLAAQTTRGTLPGDRYGQPAPVCYAASEDSWAQTIVPRLLAAGADLELVHRVHVLKDDAIETSLTLPLDLHGLGEQVIARRVALVVLDPLISQMSEAIDAHRNREVRQVLDPLVAMADRTDAVIYGVAHFNKSSGTDASSLISGSGAFKDVPRAVLGFARDDETGARVMTQTKNSLGRDDLESLAYEIKPHDVPTPTGAAHVSRLVWIGTSARSVADVLRDGSTAPEDRSERDDAAEWLIGYLKECGGSAAFRDVLKAATADQIAERTLKRARTRAGVISTRAGFGKGSTWTLPPTHSGQSGQHSEVGTNGPNAAPMGCEVCGEPCRPGVLVHPALRGRRVIAYTIHTCPEYGGIHAPVVLCDACGGAIKQSGNAYWLVLEDGSIHPQVWHTHKHPCSSLDDQLGRDHPGGMVMSEELDIWLDQLAHNFRVLADG